MRRESLGDAYPVTRRSIVAETWFWIAVVVVTVLVIAVGAYAVRWATAPAKGRLQAREQVQSGSYRIDAYDSFYDQCASVQALEVNIAAQRAELRDAPADDKNRLRTNLTGLVAARAVAITQYNADARKTATRGQFRASDLPYQLSENGETTCGA